MDQHPDWSMVNNNEAFFTSAVAALPFKIRFWRPGDTFSPLGVGGTQKLQDFFVDHKVPRSQRSCIPLLVDANESIIWVAGYRLAENFKLGPEERVFWRVSLGTEAAD